jgi:NAD(P)-dependent dehydrogenase (short-subunit alcohol dehydrogenase family)
MSKLKGTPFDLGGKVIIITGGAGFLGQQHAGAVSLAGGVPVLLDLPAASPGTVAGKLGGGALGVEADVTSQKSLRQALRRILKQAGRVDGLVNNAAANPQVGKSGLGDTGRLENLDAGSFQRELNIGLCGAVYAAQVFGAHMAENGGGVIVNIASDLALIAPDQRLYRRPGLPRRSQPVKPVGYSVVKAGLLGLNRYLATYWAEQGVRVNAICPGGVERDQSAAFRRKLSRLIPLGRMARVNEYAGALIFLLAPSSSYMTGALLTVDGGRTTW